MTKESLPGQGLMVYKLNQAKIWNLYNLPRLPGILKWFLFVDRFGNNLSLWCFIYGTGFTLYMVSAPGAKPNEFKHLWPWLIYDLFMVHNTTNTSMWLLVCAYSSTLVYHKNTSWQCIRIPNLGNWFLVKLLTLGYSCWYQHPYSFWKQYQIYMIFLYRQNHRLYCDQDVQSADDLSRIYPRLTTYICKTWFVHCLGLFRG